MFEYVYFVCFIVASSKYECYTATKYERYTATKYERYTATKIDIVQKLVCGTCYKLEICFSK